MQRGFGASLAIFGDLLAVGFPRNRGEETSNNLACWRWQARRVLATSTPRGTYGLVPSDFPRWRVVVVCANE